MTNDNYMIDDYAGGYMVSDISGKRGMHGAAYAGSDGCGKVNL